MFGGEQNPELTTHRLVAQVKTHMNGNVGSYYLPRVRYLVIRLDVV